MNAIKDIVKVKHTSYRQCTLPFLSSLTSTRVVMQIFLKILEQSTTTTTAGDLMWTKKTKGAADRIDVLSTTTNRKSRNQSKQRLFLGTKPTTVHSPYLLGMAKVLAMRSAASQEQTLFGACKKVWLSNWQWMVCRLLYPRSSSSSSSSRSGVTIIGFRWRCSSQKIPRQSYRQGPPKKKLSHASSKTIVRHTQSLLLLHSFLV